MNLFAVALVAVGAVFLSYYNVSTAKVLRTEGWKGKASALTFLCFGGTAVALLAISFAGGGPELKTDWLRPVLWSGVLNIGIGLAKMWARAIEDVSLVTPIDSTTPAIVIFFSMAMLHEYPSTLGWLGIWLMVVGTYILNIQDVRQKLTEKLGADVVGWKRQARIWFAPFLALGRSNGVRLAFIAVVLSTVSLNYDGMVARRADIGFGFGCIFAIAALGNLGVALYRREFCGLKAREAVRKASVPTAVYAIAIWLFGLAFRYSIVPYVGTMKRLQIPVAIVLAYFILGERNSFRERMAGGLIMAAGAALITLG